MVPNAARGRRTTTAWTTSGCQGRPLMRSNTVAPIGRDFSRSWSARQPVHNLTGDCSGSRAGNRLAARAVDWEGVPVTELDDRLRDAVRACDRTVVWPPRTSPG